MDGRTSNRKVSCCVYGIFIILTTVIWTYNARCSRNELKAIELNRLFHGFFLAN